MEIVQILWIGEKLSRMENACIKSWLNFGYDVHLYTYGEVKNIPNNTVIKSGSDIIPENKIFQYNLPSGKGGGSFSGFSNFFRYKLLLEKGGIWADADVFCLKKLPNSEYIFAKQGNGEIASFIIKSPKQSDFLKKCWEACMEKNPNKLKWGETGPELVSEMVDNCGLRENVFEQILFDPIRFEEVHKFTEIQPIPKSYTVHFCNEMWRRKGMDKNIIYKRESLYEKILAMNNHCKIF